MERKFESTIRQIFAPQERVYETLSNLSNIEKIRDRIPEDKLEEFTFDNDSITLKAPMVGSISMHIVDREPPKTIKFETTQSPLPFYLWIQLLPVTVDSCKMKLTVKADINPFVASMVSKPLEEGIEKIADAIQMIQY